MQNDEFKDKAMIAALQGMLSAGALTSSMNYDEVAKEAEMFADALAERRRTGGLNAGE